MCEMVEDGAEEQFAKPRKRPRFARRTEETPLDVGHLRCRVTRFNADYLGERKIPESLDVTSELKPLLDFDNYST